MGLRRGVTVTGSTTDRADKLLIWNADGTAITYVDPEDSTASYSHALVTFTSEVAADTVIDVTTSGVGYTVTGDTVSLGGSSAIFEADADLEINLNGLELEKGSSVTWSSSTTLQVPGKTFRTGEVLSIQQRTG